MQPCVFKITGHFDKLHVQLPKEFQKRLSLPRLSSQIAWPCQVKQMVSFYDPSRIDPRPIIHLDVTAVPSLW